MRRVPPILSGCTPAKGTDRSSLESLIRAYRMHNRPSALTEKEFFKTRSSLREALRHAGLAIDGRPKRYRHQCRIPAATLKRGEGALQAASSRIRRFSTFHELHEYLQKLLFPFWGLGELYVYDTTLRVAAYRGLKPEYVYLHAGTRVGARALGLNVKQRFLQVADLPKPIQSLAPDEIEDFLCIYKALLAK